MAQGRKRKSSRAGRRVSLALCAVLLLGVTAALVLWREGPVKPGLKKPQTAVVLPPEKPTAPRKAAPAAEGGKAASPSAPPQQAAHAVPPPPLSARPLGEPAWLRNAVPARETDGKPMIAVVIDDMGVDHRRSIKALALPGPMTMAFLPYANDLPRMARGARAVGHELLVHMPMQPMGAKDNPGPQAIVTGLPPEELRRRVDWMLERFDGYVGVNNHMGSKFTQDEPGMRVVLSELNARGLLFLDSRTIGNTVGPSVARSLGMPFAERDVFLDNVANADDVLARLAEVEATARRQGHAIAIGHPHDGTLEALARWLPDIERRGFVLVPVSAIVKLRMEACAGQASVVKVSNC